MPAAIRVLGRGGEDLLAGGDGDDQLTGGFGPDAFVVTEPGNGFDRSTDFATGLDGDRLAFATDVLEDLTRRAPTSPRSSTSTGGRTALAVCRT